MPKLAWLAEVDALQRAVKIAHGRSVEYGDGWCVEGTWEGDFKAGNFHDVENFFGSGVRVEGDKLVFCSSAAVIDRIFHVEWKGHFLVSNSLVQILARTGARLDISHDYAPETFASRQGIHNKPTAIRVVHPDFDAVYQDYHCNLLFKDGVFNRFVRSIPRRFLSYEAYRDALIGVLQRLAANYNDPTRRHAVAAFTTLSTGYDSTAVSALAKLLGVRECFTTDGGKDVGPRQQESGLAIANALGLTPRVLGKCSKVSALETHFLAGCTDGSEIVYHDLATYVASKFEAAVLFTGYYGDVVWDKGEGSPRYTDDIRRKDVSGLNISEVRLETGLIHVPVPQIYARNLADIMAISQSQEMRRWSVGNGYDRPIPRRIAESAGVPRGMFGVQKRAQLLYYNEPKNHELKQAFHQFLRREVKLSALHLTVNNWLHRLDYKFARMFRRRSWVSRRRKDMRALMYVWAVNNLATRMQEFWTRDDHHRGQAA